MVTINVAVSLLLLLHYVGAVAIAAAAAARAVVVFFCDAIFRQTSRVHIALRFVNIESGTGRTFIHAGTTPFSIPDAESRTRLENQTPLFRPISFPWPSVGDVHSTYGTMIVLGGVYVSIDRERDCSSDRPPPP
jgi:hypothetical protein